MNAKFNDDTNTTESERRTLFKNWLHKLQQDSWQLELLISGFALYGIYESSYAIDDLKYFVSNLPEGRGFFMPLWYALDIGWKIFL